MDAAKFPKHRLNLTKLRSNLLGTECPLRDVLSPFQPSTLIWSGSEKAGQVSRLSNC